MEEEMKIPVLNASQHGRQIVVGAIGIKELEILANKNIISYDAYQPGINEAGYQRITSENRLKKFGRYIGKGEISPPAMTWYIRQQGDGIQLKNGYIHISLKARKEPALWIADGMHRFRGILWALSEGLLSRDSDYHVTFTVTVATAPDPRFEEATQFFHINQDAKKVRTDLALQYILRRREALQGTIEEDHLIPVGIKGDDAKALATHVVKALARTDSVWKNRIAEAGQVKGDNASLSEFTKSLTTNLLGNGSVITWASGRRLTVGKLTDLIKNYWEAIFKLCPDASDPVAIENYVLTKTSGIHSLNGILPSLMTAKASELPEVPSVEDFTTVLEAAPSKFDDEYWRSNSEDGAASRGTSAKSFREIAEEIFSDLTTSEE